MIGWWFWFKRSIDKTHTGHLKFKSLCSHYVLPGNISIRCSVAAVTGDQRTAVCARLRSRLALISARTRRSESSSSWPTLAGRQDGSSQVSVSLCHNQERPRHIYLRSIKGGRLQSRDPEWQCYKSIELKHNKTPRMMLGPMTFHKNGVLEAV